VVEFNDAYMQLQIKLPSFVMREQKGVVKSERGVDATTNLTPLLCKEEMKWVVKSNDAYMQLQIDLPSFVRRR